MVLPESDTKLKQDDSGLLITSSNETSLVNIMNGMIPLLSYQKIRKIIKKITKLKTTQKK